MKMMKMMMLAGISILMVSNVMAQTATEKSSKTPEEKARMYADKMKTTVALTDDQYTKVYNLSLDISKKREVIKNTPLTEDERRAQMVALHKEKKEALKGILTAEQQAILKAKKDEMKSHKRKKHDATPQGK